MASLSHVKVLHQVAIAIRKAETVELKAGQKVRAKVRAQGRAAIPSIPEVIVSSTLATKKGFLQQAKKFP